MLVYVKWSDDEWQGRPQSVITKLAKDIARLNKRVTGLEGTITRPTRQIEIAVKQGFRSPSALMITFHQNRPM